MFNDNNITINPKLLPFKGTNFKTRVICANMHATRFTFNLLLWQFGTLCLSHKEVLHAGGVKITVQEKYSFKQIYHNFLTS